MLSICNTIFVKELVVKILVTVPFVVLSVFSFTNPAKVFAATPRVYLLTTDNFAILGGSAITSVPTSVITGDVGLSPTGGTAITGLTCAEVTGTIYDTNGGYAGGGGGITTCRITSTSVLTQAKNDLTTAYNDAAGRTTTATIPTELGGTVLTDGVYVSAAGTFGITGTLTLNGGGNADSVFIFKMASTLTTANSSQVVLTNGATACNVYWQVGSSATLGTSSTLVGNVLALTSITANTGSTVTGRLLARNGAVTLDSTTVTAQECGTSGSGDTDPDAEEDEVAGGDVASASSQTFNRDTRCLATTPLTPQWALRSPVEDGVNLLWSAVGGSIC